MASDSPVWLDADQICRLNQLVVEETGEPFGVLKSNDLHGAVMRPRYLWHYDNVEDMPILAVRLMVAIAAAHAFQQGNKRTGFIASVIFLEANGWHLDIPDFEDVADDIVSVIEGNAGEDILIELYAQHMIELAD